MLIDFKIRALFIWTDPYLPDLQGVPTQTVTFHFALAGRNMQGSFGLKVIWEF